MSKMRRNGFNGYLTEEIAAQLHALHERCRIPKSELVRQALRILFARVDKIGAAPVADAFLRDDGQPVAGQQ
jgi:Ribbon-helix-helix domain